MTTINEDGTPVLIEAMAWRYNHPYFHKCDSVEEAIEFLQHGEDYGDHSSVGVFVEGEPHTPTGTFAFPERTHRWLDDMKAEYRDGKSGR